MVGVYIKRAFGHAGIMEIYLTNKFEYWTSHIELFYFIKNIDIFRI